MIRCTPSCQPPKSVPVRFLALIQIAVLIGASFVPEGRTSVSSGGCGCSSSEQIAGTCCCSAGTGGCCSTTRSKKQDAHKTCCHSAKKTKQETDSAAKKHCCGSKKKTGSGFRSSCPCGATICIVIMLQPRLLTANASSPELVSNDRMFASECAATGRAKEAPSPPPPPRIG